MHSSPRGELKLCLLLLTLLATAAACLAGSASAGLTALAAALAGLVVRVGSGSAALGVAAGSEHTMVQMLITILHAKASLLGIAGPAAITGTTECMVRTVCICICSGQMLAQQVDRRAVPCPPTVMGRNSLVVRAGGAGSCSLQQGGNGPSSTALQGGLALLAQAPHQRLDDGVQLGWQGPACHGRCRDTTC